MNILFFLTPKSEVAYLYDDQTLRQALEIMEHHRYTAIPMISRLGKYIGTITEGDMLWGIKNEYDLSLKEAEHVPVVRQETEQLVKVLLKIKKPKHILEVGTAVGYSALVMAANTSKDVHITTICPGFIKTPLTDYIHHSALPEPRTSLFQSAAPPQFSRHKAPSPAACGKNSQQIPARIHPRQTESRSPLLLRSSSLPP